MTISISRLVSPDEIGDVLAIEEASFTNPWTRGMYESDLANAGVSHIVIARDAQGLAVGFCSFWIVVDELHLNNLAVLPLHRRSGIGSFLLSGVLAEAARLGAVRATLEVRRSNEAALRLYARWGFVVCSQRRDYYSHPVEDALVLWREQLLQTADAGVARTAR